MKTIIVDDEFLAIKTFSQVSKKIKEVHIIGEFDNPRDALDFAACEKIDLAVLDIEMPEMDGIELGRRLREMLPNIVLIYTTGYEQYALKAYGIHAAAYLLKPYNYEDLQYAIQSAEFLAKRNNHKIVIQTFGKFDVFVDGSPVFFKSSKAKELLALLVDAKGSTVTSGYAISILWEDKPFDDNSQSLFYKAAKSLEKTLEEYAISHILIKTRYERCINRKEIECDYYKLLSEDEETLKQFRGEYMSQYSWAEETLAGIFRFLDHIYK